MLQLARSATEPTTYYQCRGPMNASCGRMHRTLESACRCCLDSRAAASSSGGQCDRIPSPIVRGEFQPIDEATAIEIDEAFERLTTDQCRAVTPLG